MRIKFGNNEINVSGLLVLAGVIILDNVYANHCKKSAIADLAKAYKYRGRD